MQFPLNIHLFQKEISTHFVLEILSMFIGVRYYMFLRRRSIDSISDINRLKIFVAVCFGALIGSRLVGLFENPYDFFSNSHKFQYIFSNKTIVGGLLFALFSVELVKIKIGVKTSSGDIMTYPLLLSLIIGRIGCFCEGLNDGTIGVKTNLFTGINFGDGILRHPLPLYEIVFLISLWCFIFMLDKKKVLANGSKFKLFLISYFFYRFFIEFLKNNEFTIFDFSTIQLTCLIGLIYYSKTIIHPKRLFLHYA
jgi:phosphatidylglycerol:prolipoprotein diacylglycerol transferase